MKKGQIKEISDIKLIEELQIDSKTLSRFREIQKNTIEEAKKLILKKGKIKVLIWVQPFVKLHRTKCNLTLGVPLKQTVSDLCLKLAGQDQDGITFDVEAVQIKSHQAHVYTMC